MSAFSKLLIQLELQGFLKVTANAEFGRATSQANQEERSASLFHILLFLCHWPTSVSIFSAYDYILAASLRIYLFNIPCIPGFLTEWLDAWPFALNFSEVRFLVQLTFHKWAQNLWDKKMGCRSAKHAPHFTAIQCAFLRKSDIVP